MLRARLTLATIFERLLHDHLVGEIFGASPLEQRPEQLLAAVLVLDPVDAAPEIRPRREHEGEKSVQAALVDPLVTLQLGLGLLRRLPGVRRAHLHEQLCLKVGGELQHCLLLGVGDVPVSVPHEEVVQRRVILACSDRVDQVDEVGGELFPLALEHIRELAHPVLLRSYV